MVLCVLISRGVRHSVLKNWKNVTNVMVFFGAVFELFTHTVVLGKFFYQETQTSMMS